MRILALEKQQAIPESFIRLSKMCIWVTSWQLDSPKWSIQWNTIQAREPIRATRFVVMMLLPPCAMRYSGKNWVTAPPGNVKAWAPFQGWQRPLPEAPITALNRIWRLNQEQWVSIFRSYFNQYCLDVMTHERIQNPFTTQDGNTYDKTLIRSIGFDNNLRSLAPTIIRVNPRKTEEHLNKSQAIYNIDDDRAYLWESCS